MSERILIPLVDRLAIDVAALRRELIEANVVPGNKPQAKADADAEVVRVRKATGAPDDWAHDAKGGTFVKP